MEKRQSRDKPTYSETNDSDRGTKAVQWGKESLSDEWYWNSGISTCEKKKKRTLLHTSDHIQKLT